MNNLFDQILSGLGGLGSFAAQGQQQFGDQFAAQAQARQAQQDQFFRARQAQPPPPPSKSKYDEGDVIDIECEEVKTTKLIERP